MTSQKKVLISEEQKLRDRLALTYTERFHLLMRLIKLDRKIKSAKIIYPEKP
jgi:hypothetical protein